MQQTHPSHSQANDAIKIKEIEQILRKLDVDKAGLLFEPPVLKNSVERSLEFILSCKKNPNEHTSYIPFQGVDLLSKWGAGRGRDYEAKKIKKIRLFLDANIFMRFCRRFYYFFKNAD